MDTGTTIQLDSSGDIVIDDKNRVPLIRGVQKAQQDIKVILRSVIGSLATDPSFGIDALLMAASKDPAIVTSVISAAVEQYQYTQEVTSVAIRSTNDRTCTIDVAVTLTDGSQIRVEAQV